MESPLSERLVQSGISLQHLLNPCFLSAVSNQFMQRMGKAKKQHSERKVGPPFHQCRGWCWVGVASTLRMLLAVGVENQGCELQREETK